MEGEGEQQRLIKMPSDGSTSDDGRREMGVRRYLTGMTLLFSVVMVSVLKCSLLQHGDQSTSGAMRYNATLCAMSLIRTPCKESSAHTQLWVISNFITASLETGNNSWNKPFM